MNRQLPRGDRRRRLLTRALPLALLAGGAFVAGAVVGAPGSPARDAAARFASSWAAGDFRAMYRELNARSRERTSFAEFAAAYREAAETATLRRVEADEPGDPFAAGGAKIVPVPMTALTVSFGRIEQELEVPFADGGVEWSEALVFPGLRPQEQLRSRIELAPRAPILAIDGTPLAKGPARARSHPLGSAAIDVAGEVGMPDSRDAEALARQGFSPKTPVGVTGLEQAFNARLAGRPGGQLLAVAPSGATRLLGAAAPRAGAPVKTTIDPDLQAAAVAALAGRAGGIAVLDARSGDVRALAGQAFSAPQPPGSTFKIITTTAALQKGVVSLDDYFPIVNGVNVGGRFIHNADGEYCGGTFPEAFAESCNADFAPLGPKIGNDAMVATAERFGFNEQPSLYAERFLRIIDPPEPAIPRQIGDDLDLGVTAIGQGRVLATPLEMASVAQTVANGGVRMPTSIVANAKLRAEAKPVRVMSKRIAAQLTDLMIGVVTGGTGTAGAIPEAQVAGKTGTAELGPEPGQEDEPNPVQVKDAWFTAFAPADEPRLVAAALFIDAGAAGGDVAAPAVAQVLSAGL